MSIIRDKQLSLETMVSESNLIVEVRCLDVFEEEIPVPSDDASNPIKPFIKKGLVFEVRNTLKNTSDHTIDQVIQVPHESWRRSFSQHKVRYANGPSKSFTVISYAADVPSFEEADILFLHAFQGTYQLVAKNAFERLVKKEHIAELLGKS